MSKRIIRIPNSANLTNYLADLKGMMVNTILKNGETYFGALFRYDQESLVIKDTRNHLHVFQFSDISELIYDRQS